MNTDNMALSGETIDYGPCAFMDRYDPATVFSSIDSGGRYAYANQPPIAHWNLARLAEAMVPLFDGDVDRAVERATARLDRFPGLFEQHWLDGMRAKLGLFTAEDGDKALVDDLSSWMHDRSADFTNTFVSLTAGRPVADAAAADPGFEAWHRRWVERRARQPQSAAEAEGLMRRHNPAVIPRNHHVEAALEAATGGDTVRDGAAARRAGDPLRSRSRPRPVQRPGRGCAALPHVLRYVVRPGRACATAHVRASSATSCSSPARSTLFNDVQPAAQEFAAAQ